MKLGKLCLAVVGAAVLLGALVSSASARNLSVSAQTASVLWTRMFFAGGFGEIVCEVRLGRTFHSRTLTKTVNSLIGYITEGTVLRCSRGGATINQPSLPWHLRYRGFSGTLPNITGLSDTVAGSEWTFREPTFGITCTVSAGTSLFTLSYSVSSGTITLAAVSGTSRCGSFEGHFEGTTTNVTNGAGARITITLI